MSDNIVFFGRINEKIVKKTLLQGTIKGIFGLFFFPFSFILGSLLIAWGLFPYRRLKTLSPRLVLTEEELHFSDGYSAQNIPLRNIKGLRYEEETILVDLAGKTIPLSHFSFHTFKELKDVIDSNDLE